MSKEKPLKTFGELKSLWNETHPQEPARETGHGLKPRRPKTKKQRKEQRKGEVS